MFIRFKSGSFLRQNVRFILFLGLGIIIVERVSTVTSSGNGSGNQRGTTNMTLGNVPDMNVITPLNLFAVKGEPLTIPCSYQTDRGNFHSLIWEELDGQQPHVIYVYTPPSLDQGYIPPYRRAANLSMYTRDGYDLLMPKVIEEDTRIKCCKIQLKRSPNSPFYIAGSCTLLHLTAFPSTALKCRNSETSAVIDNSTDLLIPVLRPHLYMTCGYDKVSPPADIVLYRKEWGRDVISEVQRTPVSQAYNDSGSFSLWMDINVTVDNYGLSHRVIYIVQAEMNNVVFSRFTVLAIVTTLVLDEAVKVKRSAGVSGSPGVTSKPIPYYSIDKQRSTARDQDKKKKCICHDLVIGLSVTFAFTFIFILLLVCYIALMKHPTVTAVRQRLGEAKRMGEERRELEKQRLESRSMSLQMADSSPTGNHSSISIHAGSGGGGIGGGGSGGIGGSDTDKDSDLAGCRLRSNTASIITLQQRLRDSDGMSITTGISNASNMTIEQCMMMYPNTIRHGGNWSYASMARPTTPMSRPMTPAIHRPATATSRPTTPVRKQKSKHKNDPESEGKKKTQHNNIPKSEGKKKQHKDIPEFVGKQKSEQSNIHEDEKAKNKQAASQPQTSECHEDKSTDKSSKSLSNVTNVPEPAGQPSAAATEEPTTLPSESKAESKGSNKKH